MTGPESFKTLFGKLYSDRPPSPSPDEIDFGRWSVIFISLGEKPSAGYQIAVEEVTRSKELLTVKIGVTEPPPDGFRAMVITQPFVLMKIKKEPGLKKAALVDTENQVIESRPIPRGAEEK